MVNFLKYIGSELPQSEDDFQDSFIKSLQETVRKIKHDREMGERYMIFEEMLREEREEGRKEGRKEGLIEGEEKGRKKALVFSVRSILQVKNIMLTDIECEDLQQRFDLPLLEKLVTLTASINTKEDFYKSLNTFR